MARLRIALVGAGGMAGMHAAAYSRLEDVEIAAVVGRTPERAAALAARCGAAVESDLSRVLDDASIAAVDICTPTALHRDLIVAALRRGKHVFCETPLTPCAADARELSDLARSSDRLLQVALLSRVVQPGARIRELIRSEAYGKPICLSTERLWPGPRRGSKEALADHHGDALEELALFDFDYLVWTFGMPQRVTAVAPPAPPAEIDHVLVTLEFAQGVPAFVEASRILPRSFPFRIGARVLCERATFEWSVLFPDAGPPKLRVTRYPDDGAPEISDKLEENPYDVECRHFVCSIRGTADASLLSVDAALEGLRVLDAARRSLREGVAVTP